MSSRTSLEIAFLVLTTQCNRKCRYCFYETGYQDRADPDQRLDLDDRLLSVLRDAGIDKLILTGGEPLTVPGISETVKSVAEKGFLPLLLTNGLDLTGERLAGLVDHGLRALSLSLDSLADGRDNKAPWKVLRRAADHPALHTSAITPITRANLTSIPRIVERVRDLGLNLLLQPVFIPEHHPLHESLSLNACTPSERERIVEAVEAWESAFGASFYGALLKDFYTTGRLRPHSCRMGTFSVVVDVTGEAYPCFHRKDLGAGNLLTGNAAEILARIPRQGQTLKTAHCFGEHCISLFSHL